MPHLSKRKLDDASLKRIYDNLLLVLTKTKNKERMSALLTALLSETERVMLSKRIAVVYLLKEGVETEIIAELLKVTPFTVQRLRLWYEAKGEGYDVALEELRSQKNVETLKSLAKKLATEMIKSARFVV